MQVRSALAKDFNEWLALWKGYQSFYRVTIAPAVTEHTWQRLLDEREPMHCAVAEHDGSLVGLVHYIFHRSTWTQGDYVYLQDLFAHPDARGQGVGRALIEHVYRAAEQAKAVRVYWLTHETNVPAMQLYDRVAERSGFLQYRKTIG